MTKQRMTSIGILYRVMESAFAKRESARQETQTSEEDYTVAITALRRKLNYLESTAKKARRIEADSPEPWSDEIMNLRRKYFKLEDEARAISKGIKRLEE